MLKHSAMTSVIVLSLATAGRAQLSETQMRAFPVPPQVAAFRRRGEALLLEMGRALGQETVAYETVSGRWRW
jgi:hypothetical protein